MVICLERGANDLHMVQLMPLPPPSSLAPVKSRLVYLLVPAYPGCPRKRPLNGCSGSCKRNLASYENFVFGVFRQITKFRMYSQNASFFRYQ